MESQPVRSCPGLIYRSRAIRDVLARIEQVAPTDLSVLFEGESGVGKNLLAQHLHTLSGRGGPYISWCVSQTAPSLAHAALFGATKGAYTGLDHKVDGVIDKAESGTLFLDEIDKADLRLQEALLRLLDDATYCWLGSTEPRKSPARFVFATNRNLTSMADEHKVLSEFAHRLNIVKIAVPPLRERPEDIPPIVLHLVAQTSRKLRRVPPRVPRRAMDLLTDHPWPGNVREVSGAVLNLLTSMNGQSVISANDVELQLGARRASPYTAVRSKGGSLKDLPLKDRKSVRYVTVALSDAGGSGAKAARALNLPLRTFRSLQRKYQLRGKDQRLPV